MSEWTMHRYTNKTVYEKWGSALDNHLRDHYPQYSYRTHVAIVPAWNRIIEYLLPFQTMDYVSPYVQPIKSGHVELKRILFADYSHMIIAYAPEIDTLFVRTLFDTIPTPPDPNDKLDIEARLGL